MRKLKKIDVNFISLVDRGANRKKLLFKSLPECASLFEKRLPIKKQDEDQRIIFCIVYSPDETDSQGDCASAEVIKDAAYSFMKYARTNNIDKQHDFMPDEGFVAESWIVKENDPVFNDEPPGSWAVGIKIENEDTWLMIKNGEITGISLAGLALTEDIGKQYYSAAGFLNYSELLNNHRAEVETKFKSVTEELLLKITTLEEQEKEIAKRLTKIENQPQASRQIKSEEEFKPEKIKIWT